MKTLGNSTRSTRHKEESYSLTQSFISDTAVQEGTLVKFNGSGGVTPVTAVTDNAIGYVNYGCRNADEKVTIVTQYSGIYNLKASGSIALGDTLAGEEVDTTTKIQKMKTVSTGVVHAHALAAAADGEDVLVGILRSFVKL